MKSASNARSSELPTTPSTMSLPEFPPNDLTAGVDWARDDHALSVVNDRGREVYRCSVPHTAAGLRELVKALGKHGVGEVAIERPDGPVVDTLLATGLTVVVISPNQVKNLRGRYGSAGNKDDRFDAYVLADTLRTDRARLRPLVPDTDATVALGRTCRARKDLVKHRVAAANQLRAHLRNVFPGAVGLFADIDSEITLAFLTRFDTQDRADWLTPKRLGDWLAKQGYSGKADPTVLHQRLLDAARGATGEHATSQAHITASYVALLRTLLEQIKTLSTQIDRQLDAHPDRRPHLHQPAPLRTRPRSPPARRDRRLPREVPHPRIADLPGRRSTLDPPVRQTPRRRVPMVLRQTTARRRRRLRRRHPPRQPLGRRPLPTSQSPRPRPRPRRPHPGPSLAPHHLALLARRRPLRPRPAPRTPTRHRGPNRSGLT